MQAYEISPQHAVQFDTRFIFSEVKYFSYFSGLFNTTTLTINDASYSQTENRFITTLTTGV